MPKSKRGLRSGWLIFILVIWAAASVWLATRSNEPDAGYAVALLSVSILFEFVVIRVATPDARPLGVILALIEVLKLVVLALYWNLDVVGSVLGNVAAWASFAIACGCVVLAFAITAIHVDGPNETPEEEQSWLEKVSDVFRDGRRMAALCCFLVAFLHIDYFLTFALAFHDRQTGGKAIHAAHPSDWCIPRPAAEPLKDVSSGEGLHKIWKFFFAEGGANLECTLALKAAVEAEKQGVSQIKSHEQKGRLEYLKTLPESRKCSDDELRRAAWNLREVYRLRDAISDLRDRPGDSQYRVSILGHANRTRPSPGANDNDELSRNRATCAKLFVRQLAREAYRTHAGVVPQQFTRTDDDSDDESLHLVYDVDFVSNEPTFHDRTAANLDDAGDLDRHLSAEVHLIEVRNPAPVVVAKEEKRCPLTLLDYAYFMIYTITTTGYGDLMPVSAMAKFFTSVANLFELFFLVIVFNSLSAIPPGR
ncbi:MAG: hypothetical protein QOI24_3244 [Acidobacteriota bacterium]|jgi:hypothetical protein|nr:hypothetical protein [Acidobacteriota bacterium]